MDSFFARDIRRHYPKGHIYLITPSGDRPYSKRYGKLEVRVCTPAALHP